MAVGRNETYENNPRVGRPSSELRKSVGTVPTHRGKDVVPIFRKVLVLPPRRIGTGTYQGYTRQQGPYSYDTQKGTVSRVITIYGLSWKGFECALPLLVKRENLPDPPEELTDF